MKKYKRFWLILLLPASVLLLELADAHPDLVERLYTQFVYRYILAGTIGRIVSLFPFSLTGLCLAALLFCAVFLPLRHLRRAKRVQAPAAPAKPARRPDPVRWLSTLCAVIGVGYFAFALACGLNYHRLTFAEQSGLEVRPSSSAELAALSAQLVEQANSLRAGLPEDEDGIMMLSASPYDLAGTAQQVYAGAAVQYPQLAGYTARPKPSLASKAMSWMQISGIYIPFLFEPNVNVDMTVYNIPATMMHEMSHFRGYMREDEANFVAYLACKYSGNTEFMYSGTMLALLHSTNALYQADRELYWEVTAPLSAGVLRDITANSLYWRRFEGPVAEVSTAVNDSYLRSNKQESGVNSYGAMVDLLLAEYRSQIS